MTKSALKAYIEKDIRKLEREQNAERIRIDAPKKQTQHSSELLTYLVTRKNTLKEILALV